MQSYLKTFVGIIFFNYVTGYNIRWTKLNGCETQCGKPSILVKEFKESTIIYVAVPCSGKTVPDLYLPAFTGNYSNFITLPIGCNLPGLPPFIIRSINNMEDISKFEVQSLTGKATVFSLVIIKKGSRFRRKTSPWLFVIMIFIPILNEHRILKVYNNIQVNN